MSVRFSLNRRFSRDAHLPTNDTQALTQKQQRADDSFWKAQTAHQRTPAKEWGKG
jgi:hypothetical protein